VKSDRTARTGRNVPSHRLSAARQLKRRNPMPAATGKALSAWAFIFEGEPFFTVILENRELFCLTSLKADFVASHPFFNLLCPFRGG
jgi:hypothetical protein